MIRLNFFRPNSDGLLSSSMPTFLSFVSHCLFSNMIASNNIYIFLESSFFGFASSRRTVARNSELPYGNATIQILLGAKASLNYLGACRRRLFSLKCVSACFLQYTALYACCMSLISIQADLRARSTVALADWSGKWNHKRLFVKAKSPCERFDGQPL